jgi:hypothetical protein
MSYAKTPYKTQHMTATKNVSHKPFTFALVQFTIAVSDHASRILSSMLQYG